MEIENKRMPQRVAVVGGGAIGCYMASQVHAAGYEVTLCLRTPFKELIVESSDTSEKIPVTIATNPDNQASVDWVLIVLATRRCPNADGIACP